MELLEKAKKELETLDAKSLRVIYENAKLLNAKNHLQKNKKVSLAWMKYGNSQIATKQAGLMSL